MGVVGSAPGARIWSVKAENQHGEFEESDAVAAVNWVTAHSSQIEVANMSFGCEEGIECEGKALREAIAASVNKASSTSPPLGTKMRTCWVKVLAHKQCRLISRAQSLKSSRCRRSKVPTGLLEELADPHRADMGAE